MAVVRKVLIVSLVLGSCVGPSIARTSSRAKMTTKMTANPIRRVVNMLQAMQNKIQSEGKEEQKLFDNFMCYCKSGASNLDGSIEGAKTRIPQLESDIQKASAEKEQLTEDIAQAKKDKAAAEQSQSEAVSLREKEAAAFAKDSTEMKNNIDIMKRVVAALEKGAAGAFLQTADADTLRRFVHSVDMDDTDRQTLSSFLATGEDSDGSNLDQIIGLFTQMKATIEQDLATAESEEQAAIKDHGELLAAKSKEISSLTSSVETKMARLGEVGTELVNMADDLDDSKKGLAEDTAFLQDMDKNCATKKQEWEVRSQMRSEELLAIGKTVEILNGDDALDLFKKALPSMSLLQLQVSSKEVMHRTRQILSAASRHDARLNLISMATRGKKANFGKVLGMIDEMVGRLRNEQFFDNKKISWCKKELDKAEDDTRNHQRTIQQIKTAVSEGTSELEFLTEEIASLSQGIVDLDKKVAEATELRKQESTDYQKEMTANGGAKKLLLLARDKMNEFYNKDVAAGASFVQVNLHTDTSGVPAPPPETFGAYTKKGGESNSVVTMINLLINDLSKETAEAKADERHSQDSYERFVSQAAQKRSIDAESLGSKEAAKAETQEALFKHKAAGKSALKQLVNSAEYVKDLHGECDWLMQNFDTRSSARDDEIDSLQKAKAVLSGMD